MLLKKNVLAISISSLTLLSGCLGGGSNSNGGSEKAPEAPKEAAISNVIVGGSNKFCSSFDLDGGALNTALPNCTASWEEIAAKEFGIAPSAISFDYDYIARTPVFSVNENNLQRLEALPDTLVSAPVKTATAKVLREKLIGQSALTLDQFKLGDPLFADGLDWWNNGDLGDWNTVISSLCGTSSPVPDTTCTLSPATIDSVKQIAFKTPADKDKVVLILQDLVKDLAGGGDTLTLAYRNVGTFNGITNSGLRSEFRNRKLTKSGADYTSALPAMTDGEWAVVRSVFSDTVPVDTPRKREYRSYQYLKDAATRDMTKLMVDAARAKNGGQTPVFGIFTGSSGNPYESTDILSSFLKAAGAKVEFFALDGGLRQAIDNQDCANSNLYTNRYANSGGETGHFNLEVTYPDLAARQPELCANNAAKLNEKLKTLNGAYFLGGEQARHVETFITKDADGKFSKISPQLDILRQRFAEGKLLVAGTSAGDHFQNGGLWKGKPVPMIGGGTTYQVLTQGYKPGTGAAPDDTAYLYAQGGGGFFHYGVLDSHFSERGREARLIRTVKESGLDYGFGVDENTALVTTRPDAKGTTTFSVVGASGVFIADVRKATASSTDGQNYATDGVVAHYLRQGDTATIDQAGNLTIRLAPNNKTASVTAGAPTVLNKKVMQTNRVEPPFATLTGKMGQTGAKLGYGTTEETSGQNLPYYGITATRDDATVFRSNAENKFSYTGLKIGLAPCPANTCVAPK